MALSTALSFRWVLLGDGSSVTQTFDIEGVPFINTANFAPFFFGKGESPFGTAQLSAQGTHNGISVSGTPVVVISSSKITVTLPFTADAGSTANVNGFFLF